MAERVLELCYWYLEHLHLLLIPAALFDAICWAIILLNRRRIAEWWRRSRT